MNIPPIHARLPRVGDRKACCGCWTKSVNQYRIDKHGVPYWVCLACGKKDFTKTQSNIAAPCALQDILESDLGPFLQQYLMKYTMEMMALASGSRVTQEQAQSAPSKEHAPAVTEAQHAR